MANFTIRVVLHGGSSDHYERLHERMRLYGAWRTIVGGDGQTYDLPDGEYNLIRATNLFAVRDEVAAIADNIRANSSVLVTEGLRAWQLMTVPGDS